MGALQKWIKYESELAHRKGTGQAVGAICSLEWPTKQKHGW
jgi:hypothetical protein